jgi:ABC-type maltose transport system permease subunit
LPCRIELEDAARVDGANRFRIYWQICLPLVRGALVALSIFTFLGLWNDLFWPLIVLNKQANLTLPIGLVVLQQGSYIQRGLAFAGAFIRLGAGADLLCHLPASDHRRHHDDRYGWTIIRTGRCCVLRVS